MYVHAFCWNRFEPSTLQDVLAASVFGKRLFIFVYLSTSGGHQVRNTVSSVFEAFPVYVGAVDVQLIGKCRTL